MKPNSKKSLFLRCLASVLFVIGIQNVFASDTDYENTGNLDVMTQTSTYVVNAGDEASTFYKNGTKWEFVGKGLAGSRVPVYVSAFADGGVDLMSAVGQKYTIVLDKGMTAYTTKTGDTQVTWPRTVGPSGIDTIWIYQGLDGMNASPEEKSVSLKTAAKIKFYAPRLDFAEPVSVGSAGKVTAWKHPLTGDPDFVDGDEYFHWIGSDVNLYVVIVDPATNEVCTDCQMTLTLVDASAGVTMPGDAIYLGNGAYMVSVRSRREYMDATAYITISTAEDAKGLSLSSYTNLRFREKPAPYPQLVELYDTRGTSLGELDIPEPYYSESKNYLDGRADSLVIYYSVPFSINDQGNISPPLPNIICLNWDENTASLYNPYAEGYSSIPKDTGMTCSHIFDSLTIYNSFMVRLKTTGNNSDSVLSFVATPSFSSLVKTTGPGKVLSFSTFEDKGKLIKSHFDCDVSDRIAPVILSALAKEENSCTSITIKVSESVQIDEKYAQEAFSYYLNSTKNESQRFVNLHQKSPVIISDTNKVSLSICGIEKPSYGDFIRFRADSWIWSDTSNFASEYHWNYPTNYDETTRLPSPWIAIIDGGTRKENQKFAKPQFRIVMTGAFEFSIEMIDEVFIYTHSYTVMDTQGRILRKGIISSKETPISPLVPGSYIVKVGMGFRRVNIH